MFVCFLINLSLDLGNALTSTPNPKALNGKAESSDSGAESEEEEVHEEEKDLQLNANGISASLGSLYFLPFSPTESQAFCSPLHQKISEVMHYT